jgi:hypothetical protein
MFATNQFYDPPPYPISTKLGYSLSPQSSLKLRPLERGALMSQCVAPINRNGITKARGDQYNKLPLQIT